MKKSQVTWKFSWISSGLVGALGGLLVGSIDVATVLLSSQPIVLKLIDLVRLVSWPVLIYAGFFSLVLVVFSSLAYLASLAADNKLTKETWLGLQVATILWLSISFMLASIMGLGRELRQDYPVYAVLVGGFSGLGGYYLTTRLLLEWSRSWLKKLGLMVYLGIILSLLLFSWNISQKSRRSADFKLVERENKLTKQPANVLWIVLDTLRADHMSTYGYKRQTTPNIDKFALEATVYENAISAAPWTLPSHASMLTGLFPSQHGADGSWHFLGDNFVSLPELLQEVGYQTIAFSNNNDFFTPENNLDQGFDSFIFLKRLPQPVELILAKYIRVTKASLGIEGNKWFLNSLHKRLTIKDMQIDVGAEQTVGLVKKYLAKAAKTQQPFFVFINLMEAHDPYGDTPLGNVYLEEIGLTPLKAHAKREAVEDALLGTLGKNLVRAEDREILSAFYDGDVLYLDQKVAELLDYLRQSELLEKTMVIISSDHGENLGERGMVHHEFDIHRNLTHVPLIIRYPPVFAQNKRVKRIVQLTDIFPTLLDVIGLDDFDRSKLLGYSLLNPNRPQYAVSEARWKRSLDSISTIYRGHPDVDQRKYGGVWKSWQTETYEYIDAPFAPDDALYNLRTDPQEKQNLISQQPALVKQLRQQMIDWLLGFKHYFEVF